MTWRKNNPNGLVIYEPPQQHYCGIDINFSKDGPFSSRKAQFLVGETAVTWKASRSKEGQRVRMLMRLEGAIQQEFDANLLVKFCRAF